MIVAAIAVAVAGVVPSGSAVRTPTPLDPDNPDPAGAQAVARVLDDRGRRRRRSRAAPTRSTTPTSAPGTTVLVDLDRPARRQHHRAAARRTPAAPDAGAGRARAGDHRARSGSSGLPYTVVAGRRPARPAAPTRASTGLPLEVDHALDYPGPAGCFRGEARRAGRRAARRADAARRRRGADATTRCCAPTTPPSRCGCSAATTGWSGTSPSLDDLVADDGVSLATLLPRWIRPGALAAALALRRPGRLAGPPARPAGHRAAPGRRQGHRDHPQPRPALPPGRRPRARRRGAARPPPAPGPPSGCGSGRRTDDRPPWSATSPGHTGRPVDEVAALLGPDAPAPATDHDLIALANDLAELDREVRRP